MISWFFIWFEFWILKSEFFSLLHDKEYIVVIYPKYEDKLSDSNQFDQIEGITELNGREFPVKVINNTKFSIGDSSQFHPYENKMISGYRNQIIMPKTMHFKELKDALNFDIFQILNTMKPIVK